MAETRKMLVAFDPERPKRHSSDFLIPFRTERGTTLFGLKSGRQLTYGLMTYLGRAVTENDLFAKLVDSGTKVASVDETVSMLRQYLENLQSLRIGNVVRIKTREGDRDGFELEIVAKTSGAQIRIT